MKKLTNILILLFIPIFACAQITIAPNNKILRTSNLLEKKPIEIKIRKGYSRDIKIKVIENNTYYLNFEIPQKLKTTNIIVLNEENQILFDNALYSFTENIVLKSKTNGTITIRLTTPAPKLLESNKHLHTIKININYQNDLSSI